MKRYFHFLTPLTIFLISFLLYFPTLRGEFIFDDYRSVVINDSIKDFGSFLTIFPQERNRYVLMFTFALNYLFGGLNTFGYHLVNILIHCICSVLVYFFVKLVFKLSNELKNRREWGSRIALAIGLLFAVHPLQTQSVTYISQRASSLAGLFLFLTIDLYLLWRMSKKTRYFSISIITSVFAFFTKENTYVIPLVLILIELFIIDKKRVLFKILAIVLIYGSLSFGSFYIREHGFDTFTQLDVSEIVKPKMAKVNIAAQVNRQTYILSQPLAVLHYLNLLTIPINQNADYDVIPVQTMTDIRFVMPLFILSLLFLIAIYIHNKSKLTSFGILFYFSTLIIESSIFPLADIIQEHRIYSPSVGYFLALAGLFLVFENASTIKRLNSRYKNKIIYCVFFISVLFLSVLSLRRNTVWMNEELFWKDVVAKSPQKKRGHFNLASTYILHKNYVEAETELKKALQLDPTSLEIYNNLAVVSQYKGNTNQAEEYYKKAIEINSTELLSHTNLAGFYQGINRIDSAKQTYEHVLSIDPNYPNALLGLAQLYENSGDYGKALNYYRTAIEKNPTYLDGYYNLAVFYSSQNQFKDAQEMYEKVLDLDPHYAAAFNDLGILSYKEKRVQEAYAYLTKALRMDPMTARTYYNLVVIYVNDQNWIAAEKLLQEVATIEPFRKQTFNDLGVVKVKLGKKTEAKRAFEKALQLDPLYEQAKQNLDSLSTGF